jgi:DNA/RNA-binding domain of Phe-tRNA-synthetase-like protein
VREERITVIDVSSEVRAHFPGLYYGEAILENIVVEESSDRIEKEKQLLLKDWLDKSKSDLVENQVIQTYREFYRSLGLDPKKNPPAMESLIVRCVLRGFFPKINNVVDACNVASAKYLLPMAVFDLDRFVGQAVLRYSREGELLQPIGRTQPESIKSGLVILSDEANVLSVFSYKDSEFYKIQPETRNVLLIACHVSGIADQRITDALNYASNLIKSPLDSQ